MTETRKTEQSRRFRGDGGLERHLPNKNTHPSKEVSWSKLVVEGHFICILLNFSMAMVSCIYV